MMLKLEWKTIDSKSEHLSNFERDFKVYVIDDEEQTRFKTGFVRCYSWNTIVWSFKVLSRNCNDVNSTMLDSANEFKQNERTGVGSWMAVGWFRKSLIGSVWLNVIDF